MTMEAIHRLLPNSRLVKDGQLKTRTAEETFAELKAADLGGRESCPGEPPTETTKEPSTTTNGPPGDGKNTAPPFQPPRGNKTF